MQQDIIQSLVNLGLNEKQVKVYLACLDLGGATIQEIALKSGVKRTSIYNFIDKLIEKSLISKTQKENRYLFLAESPALLKRLQKRNEVFLNKKMPELMQKFEKSKIGASFKYFRGKEATKKILKESLDVQKGEVLVVAKNKAGIDVIGKRFVENCILKVKAKGIKSKMIRSYGQENKHKFFSIMESMNCEVRELPREMKIENSVLILDNKVVSFSSFEENYGFVIESESFTKTMKTFFNALWILSEPSPK